MINYFNNLAHLCVCTMGSYASLSVCLAGCDWTKNQSGPKVTRPKPFNLESWNLVRTLTWMTLRVKVTGQMSRSLGQKNVTSGLIWPGYNLWGQGSHGSMSKVIWVKVKGRPWRSRSSVQKCGFRSHLTILQVLVEVKGHMGQGQRSHGSRSKVKWVKLSLKVIIWAGGLTSTSGCFIVSVSFSFPFVRSYS